MNIIKDNLWLCSDCTLVACNGSYGTEVKDLDATERGLAELGSNLVSDFDSETNDGIETCASTQCAACKTGLLSYRARFAILG
jgi:hypothetical protein